MYALKNLTQNEIEHMINSGRKVYWKNKSYVVIKDKLGQFLIKHESGDCVGLESEFAYNHESDSFLEN